MVHPMEILLVCSMLARLTIYLENFIQQRPRIANAEYKYALNLSRGNIGAQKGVKQLIILHIYITIYSSRKVVHDSNEHTRFRLLKNIINNGGEEEKRCKPDPSKAKNMKFGNGQLFEDVRSYRWTTSIPPQHKTFSGLVLITSNGRGHVVNCRH